MCVLLLFVFFSSSKWFCFRFQAILVCSLFFPIHPSCFSYTYSINLLSLATNVQNETNHNVNWIENRLFCSFVLPANTSFYSMYTWNARRSKIDFETFACNDFGTKELNKLIFTRNFTHFHSSYIHIFWIQFHLSWTHFLE